jgi:hypothetical protein
MKLRSIATWLMLGLCVVQAVSGQNTSNSTPGLAGRWILNEKKSFGNSDSNKFYEEYILTFSENGPEVKISFHIRQNGKLFNRTSLYFTDGRGEENLIQLGNVKDFPVSSKTKRESDRITIRFEYSFRKEKQRGYMSGTLGYRLKDMGKQLVFTRTTRGDFPDAKSSMGQPSGSSGYTQWFFDRMSN